MDTISKLIKQDSKMFNTDINTYSKVLNNLPKANKSRKLLFRKILFNRLAIAIYKNKRGKYTKFELNIIVKN